jgi:hypothetical protein
LDRRLGEPQSRSGRHGEVKILDPHRDSNPDPSVVQPVDVAIPAHRLTVLYITSEKCSSPKYLSLPHTYQNFTLSRLGPIHVSQPYIITGLNTNIKSKPETRFHINTAFLIRSPEDL